MFHDPDAWVQPDQEAAEFAALLEVYKRLSPFRVLESAYEKAARFISGWVPRFWEEIKKRFTCEELVSHDNQSGYGIGLVYL